MHSTLCLKVDIEAAAVTLANVARRQGPGDYQTGYLDALGDLLGALDIGPMGPAVGDAWQVREPAQLEIAP